MGDAGGERQSIYDEFRLVAVEHAAGAVGGAVQGDDQSADATFRVFDAVPRGVEGVVVGRVEDVLATST